MQNKSTDLWDNPDAVALVEEEVERAVAPFVGTMSDERLEAMRRFVRDALMTHPALSRFTALAVPRADVQETGTVETDPTARAAVHQGTGTKEGEGG